MSQSVHASSPVAKVHALSITQLLTGGPLTKMAEAVVVSLAPSWPGRATGRQVPHSRSCPWATTRDARGTPRTASQPPALHARAGGPCRRGEASRQVSPCVSSVPRRPASHTHTLAYWIQLDYGGSQRLRTGGCVAAGMDDAHRIHTCPLATAASIMGTDRCHVLLPNLFMTQRAANNTLLGFAH